MATQWDPIAMECNSLALVQFMLYRINQGHFTNLKLQLISLKQSIFTVQNVTLRESAMVFAKHDESTARVPRDPLPENGTPPLGNNKFREF